MRPHFSLSDFTNLEVLFNQLRTIEDHQVTMSSPDQPPQERTREQWLEYATAKISKHCQSLSLPSAVNSFAQVTCTQVFSIEIQKKSVRPLAAACIFYSCRLHNDFETLVTIVDGMSSGLTQTLKALWYIENDVEKRRGGAAEWPLMVAYTKASESPFAFPMKSEAKKEVLLSWEGGPKMKLMGSYNTKCAALRELRLQRLDRFANFGEGSGMVEGNEQNTFTAEPSSQAKETGQKSGKVDSVKNALPATAGSTKEVGASDKGAEEQGRKHSLESVNLTEDEDKDWELINSRRGLKAVGNGKGAVAKAANGKGWIGTLRNGLFR